MAMPVFLRALCLGLVAFLASTALADNDAQCSTHASGLLQSAKGLTSQHFRDPSMESLVREMRFQDEEFYEKLDDPGAQPEVLLESGNASHAQQREDFRGQLLVEGLSQTLLSSDDGQKQSKAAAATAKMASLTGHGWTKVEFEAVGPGGWCTDSMGMEARSRSFVRGDSCRKRCIEDETCPGYAFPSRYGWCAWYTDKDPKVFGERAVSFFIEGSTHGRGSGWSTAKCYRKKLDTKLAWDTETMLSPPFTGAFTVSQAPLQCRPSHCGGNGNGYAVDWAMPKGTPIITSRGGMVVQIADGHGDGGPCWDRAGEMISSHNANFVAIQHSDGTVAVYLHLLASTVKVQPGNWVKRGTVLAKSGNSGCSTGPHLHFHVRRSSDFKTVPVHFNWPCQKKYRAVPKDREFQCNVDGCECTPPCWKTWTATKPEWLRDAWAKYCSSSWTPSYWAMSKDCGSVWYSSDEAVSIEKCGSECETFDKNREHCK